MSSFYPKVLNFRKNMNHLQDFIFLRNKFNLFFWINLIKQSISPKETIFFFDSLLPDPRNGRGSPRMYSILKVLQPHFNLIFFHRLENRPKSYGARISLALRLKGVLFNWTKSDASTFWILSNLPKYSDYKWISKVSNIEEIKDLIVQKELLFDINLFIFDTEALSQKIEKFAFEKNFLLLNNISPRVVDLKHMEIFSICKHIVVNDIDEAELKNRFGVKNIFQLGHFVNPIRRVLSFNSRSNICFIGNCDNMYSSNSISILWFSQEIFPKLKNIIPNLQLYIIGSACSILKSKLECNDIIFTGNIRNPGQIIKKSKVNIAPNMISQGIPFKVDYATSFGTPTVLPENMAKQLKWVDLEHCLTYNSEVDLLHKLEIIYKDEVLWNKISSKAIQGLVRSKSYENLNQVLKQIFI